MSSQDECDIYDHLPDSNITEDVQKIQERYKKLSRIAISLKKRLKESAEQNQTLKEENQQLKENISSLYKTAVKEIQRKDRTIAELRAEKDNFAFRRHQQTFNSNKSVQHDSKNKRITDIEKHDPRNASDISNKNSNDTSLPREPYIYESNPETCLEPLNTEDTPEPNIDTPSVKPPPNPYNTHMNTPLTLYSQRLLNRVLTSSKTDICTKIKNEPTSSPFNVDSREPKQIVTIPVKQEHSSSMLADKESFTKGDDVKPFVSDSPEAVISSKQTNVISCKTESLTKSIKNENSGLTSADSSITIMNTPRQFISDSSKVVTKRANVDSRASSPIVTQPDNQSSRLSTSAVENSVTREQNPQSFDSDLFSLTHPESNKIIKYEDTSNCNSIKYSSSPSVQHVNKTKLVADDAKIEKGSVLSQLPEYKFEDKATGNNCTITTEKNVLVSSTTTRTETTQDQSLRPGISDIKSEPVSPHAEKVSPSSSSSEHFGFKRRGRVKIINVITPSKGEIIKVNDASTEKKADVCVSKRPIDNINQDNDASFSKQLKISDAVSTSNKSVLSSGTGECHDLRQEKENLFSGISRASGEREDETTERCSESKSDNFKHVSKHIDDKSRTRDDKLSLEPAKITYKRYSDQDIPRRHSNDGFDKFKLNPKMYTKARGTPETDKDGSLKYHHSSSKCEDEKSYTYDGQSSSRHSRRKYSRSSRSSSSREMSGHSSPRRSGNREKVRIKYSDAEETYRSRSRSSSDNSKKQIHTTHSGSEPRNSSRAKRTVLDKKLESREVVCKRPAVENRSALEVLYRVYSEPFVTHAAETWTMTVRLGERVSCQE
uniref:CASP8-associated protein 2 n=1 Tax=Timema genevievae TaxID=629358 RepID=A0A7R9PMF4_TIMGE|nr:unnamed protein product [Timema genevievae]